MIHIKPSAIIFDFDDTLVNAKPIINKALAATFADFNIDQNLLDIDFNRSLRDYFHLIFKENVSSAREAYLNYYLSFAQDLEALPGAESVLRLLQEHQVFTSLVSNKGGERLRSEVQHKFNWQKYFVNIIGSGDAHEDKPSIAPALLALQGSGLEHYEDVWFIGDSIVDLQTAANLGCKAVLYSDNVTKTDLEIHLNALNHQALLSILGKLYA